MSAANDILITGGVAAVIGAAIGGGCKILGVEVPLVASVGRQVLLFGLGLCLIVGGLLPSFNWSPKTSPIPKLMVSGADVIDFRPSVQADERNGYLLVTTNIAIENSAESSAAITWRDSKATLYLGGAQIPFRSFYFTNLTNNLEPWVGENAVAVGPESIMPGKIAKHDLMFLPMNTGTGRYPWSRFLKEVLDNHQTQPKFEVRFEIVAGEAEVSVPPLECTAQLEEHLSRIKRDDADHSYRFWISAECTK